MHGEYLRRVRVFDNENDEMVIKVDLHGMCRESAQKALSNIIAIIRSPFILDVIHGYNGGEEMIALVEAVHADHRTHGYRWTAAYIRLEYGYECSDNYIYKCFRYLGIKSETKHQVHYRKRKEKDRYRFIRGILRI